MQHKGFKSQEEVDAMVEKLLGVRMMQLSLIEPASRERPGDEPRCRIDGVGNG